MMASLTVLPYFFNLLKIAFFYSVTLLVTRTMTKE